MQEITFFSLLICFVVYFWKLQGEESGVDYYIITPPHPECYLKLTVLMVFKFHLELHFLIKERNWTTNLCFYFFS